MFALFFLSKMKSEEMKGLFNGEREVDDEEEVSVSPWHMHPVLMPASNTHYQSPKNLRTAIPSMWLRFQIPSCASRPLFPVT